MFLGALTGPWESPPLPPPQKSTKLLNTGLLQPTFEEGTGCLILGGVVLGQRVAMPAWPAWSLRALGSPSLVLAVVVVCAGVPPAHIFVFITLFCYMRWLCKSPFVFGKSQGVVRRNKLLIDCLVAILPS